MKSTIIEDKPAEVTPPVPEFPALYEYSPGGNRIVALATGQRTGVVISSKSPLAGVGHHYNEHSAEWEFSGWTRITAPITIRFDPAN